MILATRTIAAGLALGCLISPAVAQNSASGDAIRQLRQQMEEIRSAYTKQIEALETRINTLEQEKAARAAAATQPAAGPASQPQAPGTFAVGPGQSFQIGLSTSMAAGGSSAANDVLGNLQRGGHDPNKNGFTLQSAELFVGGTVDPYFDAQATIALSVDAEGETSVELEEAFFVTRSLPWGLQVKGGQYLTEFGRINTQHLHQWAFVDQPVIVSRLLGPDGLRSQGARVSWLTPLPWFSELTFGAQNPKGEGAPSFLGEAGEMVAGRELLDRQVRDGGDLLYSARWLNGVDVTRNLGVNVGLSGAFGPNATGGEADTYIIGADFYAKWQPEQTVRGFPFVSLHGEAMMRRYEAGDPGDPESEKLYDRGFFVQGLWGFVPGWVAGLRFDWADGDGDNAADPLRDRRKRLSPNVTWYPTEFSRLRAQYNRDWADHLSGTSDNGAADTFWLQLEVSLGGHFAHTF